MKRLKQKGMYGLSAKEKTVCCRELAVSAGGSIVFSPYYCACPSFSGNSIRGKMGNENFPFAIKMYRTYVQN